MDAFSMVGDFFASSRFYWGLAIVGTTFFLVQMVLVFVGVGGEHGDMSMTDANGDGTVDAHHLDSGMLIFKLFSLRTVTVFIMFFGWAGVFWGHVGNGWGGFFIALGSGFSMMFLTALLLYLVLQLGESGNIEPDDFVGQVGSVYLTIPAGKAQCGKVSVSLSGCTREITAVAESELKTGETVKIVQRIDGNRYLAEKA